jgi:hypothetical protein
MQLKYLETSALGLRWMRAFYQKNSQLNRAHAVKALKKAEETLRSFPYSGELYEDFNDVREYHIYATAFSFLYTCVSNTIWIIDVRDQRGNRSAAALRDFNTEISKKHGLIGRGL